MNLTKLDHAPRDISYENKSALAAITDELRLHYAYMDVTWYFCKEDNDYYVKIYDRVFRVRRQSWEPLEEVEDIE